MPRNSGRTTSTLALALALKLLAVPVSPSGPAFDEEPVKKVCKVAKTLTDIEGVALAKIQSLINQVSAANEAAAKANLAAAAATDSNTSTLYAAAGARASRCSTDAATALATLAPIALNAATNGAKTSGHISEVIDILRQAGKGRSTSKCIVQKGDSTATLASTVTAYGCPAEILEPPEPRATVDASVMDNKGFKTLSAKTDLHSGNAQQTCIFLVGANDNAAKLWKANGGPGSAVNIAQGFITIKPHDTAASATAQTPALNALGNSWATPEATTAAAKLYNKIGQLEKHMHNSSGETADEVLDSILATENLKAALLAVINKPKGAPAKPTEDEIATALINSVEPAATTQSQKLKDKILNTLVPKLTEGSRSQVKLSTLEYPGEIQTSTLAAIQELKNGCNLWSALKAASNQSPPTRHRRNIVTQLETLTKTSVTRKNNSSYDDSEDSSKKCNLMRKKRR
uniref:Variant surface glycoprotein 1207 n=1 Tax=Trypanosoma brucei TaxID=5691 RepID=M4TB20_9TRYP|nr:variant surface glycoprotein 1207 [Trypanosoma brucei]